MTCGTVLSTDQTLWISVEHASRIMCAHMRAYARTLWGRASPPPKQQRSESGKTKRWKRWKNHALTLIDPLQQLKSENMDLRPLQALPTIIMI